MRKSVLRTLALSASLTMMLTVSAFAENATVTGNGVNVRSGPGVNYAVLDSLPRDSTVTITDRSNGSWYAVSYNGKEGFMSSSYLRITESVPEIQATVSSSSADITAVVSSGNGYINAMYVRFRSGPSSGYAVLGEYNTGKVVTITGTSGSWTAVTIDGVNGYVFSSYVTSGLPSSGNTVASVAPAVSQPSQPVPEAETVTGTITVNSVTAPVAAETVPTPTPTPAINGTYGTITGNGVRFRSGPSSGYSILDNLNYGQEIIITGESNGWSAVSVNGVSGYVYSQYVAAKQTEAPAASATTAQSSSTVTGTTTAVPVTATVSNGKEGYITGNNVRFRTGPGNAYQVISELYYGNSVTITGTQNGWVSIICNGRSGYVYGQYVKEGSSEIIDAVVSAVVSGSSSVTGTGTAAASDIVTYGLSLVGSKYSWGGASPETGFDCSGFVYYVFSHFGYSLKRVAADQASDGTHVDPANMQPGDILCFYSGSSYIGHVGIYIGNNKFVHACNANTGVIVTDLSGYYATRGYEVRRIAS